MTRCRPIALLAAWLILGMSATPDAIAQKATVEGHARAEEGGAPVQFALVRLVRADSSPLPSDERRARSPRATARGLAVAASPLVIDDLGSPKKQVNPGAAPRSVEHAALGAPVRRTRARQRPP